MAKRRNAQTTTAQATTAEVQTVHQVNATTTAQEEMTAFEKLMRNYEFAQATGADTTAPLMGLAQAVALSVIAKCCDPQRKNATDRETVSNGGQSPALLEIRRGIMADIALLDNTVKTHNSASRYVFNANGDYVREVVDQASAKNADELSALTLSDGLDLVNTAVVAILEQTETHATTAPGWLENEYTMRRLSRRVLIGEQDSAKWEEVQTTPISEVYRAVRREVQNSRAMRTDPRNGYSYIEELTADPDSTSIETVYRRLHKWADIGGFTMTGHFDEHGNASRGGQYTTTAQNVADYDSVMNALNLTTRQATIVRLRMSGYGYTAIATYLGVTDVAIINTLKRVQAKAEKIGFTPEMWREMTGRNVRID